MRATFVFGVASLVALGGCPASTDDGGAGGYYDPGDPGSEPGCHVDTDCSSYGSDYVCARDGECLPSTEVRAIKVTWTVRGQPATASTCADSPDLEIEFDSYAQDDTFGFAPVPCVAGEFPIDKLPTRYVQADLGVNNTSQLESAQIDPTTGLAAIDLTP